MSRISWTLILVDPRILCEWHTRNSDCRATSIQTKFFLWAKHNAWKITSRPIILFSYFIASVWRLKFNNIFFCRTFSFSSIQIGISVWYMRGLRRAKVIVFSLLFLSPWTMWGWLGKLWKELLPQRVRSSSFLAESKGCLSRRKEHQYAWRPCYSR